MPKYRRGSGSVYLKRGWCYIKYYRDGKPIAEATGTKNKAEARRLLQARLGQLAEGRYIGPAAERVTFDDMAEMVVNDYRVNGRKSLKWVGIRLRLHLAPFFANKRAHQITTAEVQAYIAKRQGEGAKNGTINLELASLKRMFALAMQAEKITKKPHIPLLEWQQVDLETGTVRLEVGTTKNKDGRVIYLTHELQDLLDAQWREHLAHYPDCPFVFSRPNGQRIKNIYWLWKKACRVAGLSGKIPHDFRRTAVRNMVRAGIPERVAMMISGHKTRTIFDRYHIVSDGDLREAARRLEAAQMLQTATISVTTGSSEDTERVVTH